MEELRPLMLSIAYRMVGSFSEAEDLVQEAFVRLHEAGEIEAPRAWLSTVVTRLAIDHLRSARVRREQYPGTWLPEPVMADPAPDAAMRAEDLSLAVLVLLESLSPVERAVFVLREAFDYGYDEIAEIVDKSPANVRQLAVRARRHVDERRPRFEPSREQREELARRFVAALHEGETEPLLQLLAADATFDGDGGGKAAAVGPLVGRDRIAPVLAGFGRVGARRGITARLVELNGQPGVLGIEPGGTVVAAWALLISDGAIRAIHGVTNPDKLAHISSTILPSLPPA
ncbi:MAG TPA: RNA polymerase sigma factor SigJ [Solirubrobacteraceae bacterium]|nr:RNA polymerase sigma factor SigJ [Solirubrobacteraceae bacterium]